MVDLMCPCCGQAVPASEGDTQHQCGRCGQQWVMVVDLDRIAKFSVL